MARRKKNKTSKSHDAPTDPLSEHKVFIESLEMEIDRMKRLGFDLKPRQPQPPMDPVLAQLKSIVSPEEFRVLKESGAFGPVDLELTTASKEWIKTQDLYYRTVMRSLNTTTPCPRTTRPPQPPVPVFADQPSKNSGQALAGELRYLRTVLQPAEMRWLVGELAFDSIEKAPVTHTDISDAVIASIAPSTAQKIAFQADAQYKYTSAQFLQVYMKMRNVVLEHKIMLAGADADALLLAMSGLEFDKLRPEDDVAVSAVEALRNMIDAEDMLR